MNKFGQLIFQNLKPNKSLPIKSFDLKKKSNIEAFKKFDFPQSSHHIQIFKINLHLFDDSSKECKKINKIYINFFFLLYKIKFLSITN